MAGRPTLPRLLTTHWAPALRQREHGSSGPFLSGSLDRGQRSFCAWQRLQARRRGFSGANAAVLMMRSCVGGASICRHANTTSYSIRSALRHCSNTTSYILTALHDSNRSFTAGDGDLNQQWGKGCHQGHPARASGPVPSMAGIAPTMLAGRQRWGQGGSGTGIRPFTRWIDRPVPVELNADIRIR